MSLRSALVVAIMLGTAGLGIVGWIGLRLPADPPPAAATATPRRPPVVRVLVASRELRAGGLLKYDDIQSIELPAAEAPPGAQYDTQAARTELAGSMVRHALHPQDILLGAYLLRPGDRGFLASVLRPGMRATTVGVDAVSGTAGLIWPGDHVDVILTQVTDDRAVPASHRASAETVLADVRVIAIDQQLMQGATGSATENGTTHTVTLEVTDTQAERVALAARLGHLSLIVRAADPTGDDAPARPATVWGGDVSPALNHGPTNGRVIRVFHGTGDGKELRF